MKRLVIILIALIISAGFSSCSLVEDQVTRITDPEEYEKIWDLSEFRGEGGLRVFPEKLDGLTVEKLECIHVTRFPIGTDWQVLLTVKYDADGFDAELGRLRDLCRDSFICGKNDYFDKPAFASLWNCILSFEYAVADEEALTVSYVYLQEISNAEKIGIDSLPLPKGYSYEMDSPQLSIPDRSEK